MKKLCKNLFRIILLCISSPSFASSTMWTAATFASHGVRGFTDPGDISPASIAAMAATGANVLRYFVVLEPNTGNSSATSYTWNSTLLSDVVSSATANGLKVIIVLSPDSTHMPRGYLWGVGDTSTQANSLKASFASIWKSIASTYNGNSTIAAYDLYNEPVTDGDNSAVNTQANQNTWIAYATTLINTIRAVDPSHVIIFEPNPWGLAEAFGSTLPNTLPFGNIVYSFHFYDPHPLTQEGLPGYPTQYTYPGANIPGYGVVNASTLASVNDLPGVIAFQQKFNVSIYVGEFSCIRWAPIASNGLPSSYNWVHDAIPLFEAQNWAWTYHSWREYFGWAADMPDSYFYKFPYTNASPINAPNFYNAYNSNLIVGDPAGNRIGFTGMYSNSTDTMALLINYFKLNTQNPPPPPPPPPSGIVNGSFETPSTSSYSYRPTGGSWTFAVSSGIQHNGSAWGAPNAPDGVQTAFLQDGTNEGNGTISQSIYLPSSGTYTVSFQAALRAYQTSPTPMSFKVTFDSTVVGSFSPTSRSFSSFTTAPISLTAGFHTLSFVGTGAAPDTSDFIDSVTLNQM